MLDPEVKPTITAFCAEIDIARKTYYEWFDNEDFVTWFNREWEIAMAKQVSWLDRVGLMKSPKDFRYWEAMQMKYGKYARKEKTEGSLVIKDQDKINEVLKKYVAKGSDGKGSSDSGTPTDE